MRVTEGGPCLPVQTRCATGAGAGPRNPLESQSSSTAPLANSSAVRTQAIRRAPRYRRYLEHVEVVELIVPSLPSPRGGGCGADVPDDLVILVQLAEAVLQVDVVGSGDELDLEDVVDRPHRDAHGFLPRAFRRRHSVLADGAVGLLPSPLQATASGQAAASSVRVDVSFVGQTIGRVRLLTPLLRPATCQRVRQPSPASPATDGAGGGGVQQRQQRPEIVRRAGPTIRPVVAPWKRVIDAIVA